MSPRTLYRFPSLTKRFARLSIEMLVARYAGWFTDRYHAASCAAVTFDWPIIGVEPGGGGGAKMFNPSYGFGAGAKMFNPAYGSGAGPKMFNPAYGFGAGPKMFNPAYGFGAGAKMFNPAYGFGAGAKMF